MLKFMAKEKLHVVTGHPYSDIGKGWLTTSIAKQLNNPILFKIDPMLSPSFPAELGYSLEKGSIVSDDAKTYMQRGFDFQPEQNIVIGNFLRKNFELEAINEGILDGEVSKITWSDLTVRLADFLKEKIGKRDSVIEMGGCPDDMEANFLPGVIRLLSHFYETNIHILTCFSDTTINNKVDPKTRVAVRAAIDTMQAYWNLPLHTLWIRRASVPKDIPDTTLKEATKKIAFKLQLDPNKVVYIPNVSKPEDLDFFIKTRFYKNN